MDPTTGEPDPTVDRTPPSWNAVAKRKRRPTTFVRIWIWVSIAIIAAAIFFVAAFIVLTVGSNPIAAQLACLLSLAFCIVVVLTGSYWKSERQPAGDLFHFTSADRAADIIRGWRVDDRVDIELIATKASVMLMPSLRQGRERVSFFTRLPGVVGRGFNGLDDTEVVFVVDAGDAHIQTTASWWRRLSRRTICADGNVTAVAEVFAVHNGAKTNDKLTSTTWTALAAATTPTTPTVPG